MDDFVTTMTERLRAAAAEAPPTGKSLRIELAEGPSIRIDGRTVDNQALASDCTVYVAQEDLQAIAMGDLDPTAAFMTGKLRVDGDVGVAMALQSIIGRAFG